MNEYLILHEANLDLNHTLNTFLFGIKSTVQIGVQQIPSSLTRSPKNPNQILVNLKPPILENEYNYFLKGAEAFEVLKDFVVQELKIESGKNTYHKLKAKDLYFYIFENIQDDPPKLRGVFYATTKTNKPSFWVALVKNLEFEYEREIFKK